MSGHPVPRGPLCTFYSGMAGMQSEGFVGGFWGFYGGFLNRTTLWEQISMFISQPFVNMYILTFTSLVEEEGERD